MTTTAAPVPPPSPIHHRSHVQRTVTQDDEDMVAETTDSTMIVRITPHQHGEEILSVEMAEEEEDGKVKETEQAEKKEE